MERVSWRRPTAHCRNGGFQRFNIRLPAAGANTATENAPATPLRRVYSLSDTCGNGGWETKNLALQNRDSSTPPHTATSHHMQRGRCAGRRPASLRPELTQPKRDVGRPTRRIARRCREIPADPRTLRWVGIRNGQAPHLSAIGEGHRERNTAVSAKWPRGQSWYQREMSPDQS